MAERTAKYQFKFAACGAANVGKTSLLRAMIGKKFEERRMPTIGSDLLCNKFTTDAGDVCLVSLWDTAGQEQFASVSATVFRGADAIIGVYDITSEDSYGDKFWKRVADAVGLAKGHFPTEEASLSVPPPPHKGLPYVVIVGNKLDRDADRAIRREDVKAVCDQRNYSFMETSARDGSNITNLVTDVLRGLTNLHDTKPITPRQQQHQQQQQRGKVIKLQDPSEAAAAASSAATAATLRIQVTSPPYSSLPPSSSTSEPHGCAC